MVETATRLKVKTASFPHIGERSPETSKLIDLLRQRKDKGVVTDQELVDGVGVGCAPGQPGYGKLASACRFVFREDGVLWKRQHNAHYLKRLDATETLESARGDVRSIHRRTGRAVHKTRIIDPQELPESDRPAHLTLQAQLATLAAFSKKDAVRQITGVEKEITLKLPWGKKM